MSGDPSTVILDQTGLSSSLFILICLSSYPPVYIQSMVRMLQVEGQAEARSRPPTLFCTGCSDFITATLTHTGGVSMPFKAQVHSDSQVRSTKHPVPTQTFSMPGHPRTLQIEPISGRTRLPSRPRKRTQVRVRGRGSASFHGTWRGGAFGRSCTWL